MAQKSETEHLLSSPANAERLQRSIEQMDARPKLVRAVRHSRRFYFLDGKRISEKEANWLISRDAVRLA